MIWLFDALLAGGLVYIAWRSLRAASLFTAVVLFIAFGLLMALAWTRLDATDIALAEAAIGAGLTGALMLDALGHVAGEPRDRQTGDPNDDDGANVIGMPARGLAILTLALGVLIGFSLYRLPAGEGLAGAVAAAMADHPVSNPATAVLLDFRAYDTFLEMGVLALAGFGAFILKARELRVERATPPARGSIMLAALTTMLVPLMVLVALYLFWAGTAQSGGAFPGGAMLAAAGVLLVLAGIGRDSVTDNHLTRAALAAGLTVFILAGLVAMAGGGAFLQWSEGWTYAAILTIEAVLTLAIGATLGLLYAASAKLPDAAGRDGG